MSLQAGPSKVSLARLRTLVWEGVVPLCITVDPSELPAGADRTMEAYYVNAPRLGYLPMLLEKMKANFLALLLDEASFLSLVDANMWFEHTPTSTALRWHWPVGLLYDTLVTSSPSAIPLPLALTLRLSPPPLDRLLLPNSVSSCRDAFMNQIKEADFVRFGSTRRVTNLRQREAESLWEGLQEQDFDKFWTVAGKLIPSAPVSSTTSPSLGAPTLSPQPSGTDRVPDGNSVRNVPLRIYLPYGASTLQSNIPPLSATGTPATLLYSALSSVAPLLFPSPPVRRPLATAIVQGMRPPLDAEIGWLGAVMCGADGWLNVVVKVPA